MTLPPAYHRQPDDRGRVRVHRQGATVQVSLPRPRGLRELPQEEIVERAQQLAKIALEAAAATLAHEAGDYNLSRASSCELLDSAVGRVIYGPPRSWGLHMQLSQ